ncbi:hypothetical protein [Paraburkholderia graminis]|uniref:hypothetical protein n=1 Tax=Paraburkholderia graminis TaxID=60548 RepID=UPI0038B93432
MTKPQRYGVSSMPCDQGLYVLHKDYLALEAECEALRAVVGTPIAMKIRFSAMSEIMYSGFSWHLADDALRPDAPRSNSITVYYGTKRTFKTGKAFLKAHPKEQA